MKVAWAASHYPPDGGDSGSAESVRLAAEALAARGHEVTLVTPDWAKATLYEPGGGSLRILRFGPPLSSGQTERPYLGPRWIIRASRMIAAAARDADLIHAQDRRLLLPALIAGRLRGRPVVLTLRDVGWLCPAMVCTHGRAQVPPDCGQPKLWRQCGPAFRDLLAPGLALGPLRARLALRYAWLGLERRLARGLALVGFVSDALRRTYASAGWPPAGVPTAVLYSPVSEEAPRPGAPFSRVALFVGKPSPGKGWPAFVEASRHVQRAFFVHVGPAPTGNPGRVGAVGPRPRAAVLAWMRTASLVCVPSVQQDALPRVALEAASQERVVVASAQGGLPEVVEHGETGWILPIGGRIDGLALQTGIEMVLDDPGRAEKMGRAARAHVLGKFGPAPTTGRLLAAYQQVLA